MTKKRVVNATLCVLCENHLVSVVVKNLCDSVHKIAKKEVVRPAHGSDLKFLIVNELLDLCAHRRP